MDLDTPSLPEAIKCEDCDRPLESEEAEVMGGMDVDGEAGGDPWACSRCAKRVCRLCGVAWDLRVCLGCAFER